MTLLGLHIIDVLIIAAYVVGVIWIGRILSKRQHSSEEFFLASRGIGKVYQFFLNFGESINADNAAAVSREVYRQGVGGMWINFIVLFVTPFHWFTTMLFRRVRLLTVGDFIAERFESKFLGAAFAAYVVLYSILRLALVYVVVGKTMMALTPIPEHDLTQQQQQSVRQFVEYQELKTHKANGIELTEPEQRRYKQLSDQDKLGELRSFFSYINPTVLYFGFALVVCIYTMMGGLRAAVITDAIQGVLILFFSLILIPIGLSRVGGFEQLHRTIPDYRFQVFGSEFASDYAWPTVFALTLSILVSTMANPTNMSVYGSAKTELDARVGLISGVLGKRFLMIAWALTGLLAYALYAGQIHDPDLIWGHMARNLLAPGLLGLLLVGILAAAMSTLDALSISYSALFISNLYRPLVRDKSERHYVNIGRLVIAAVMVGGIYVALFVDDILTLLKYAIPIPACFGAAIWLGFLWRRVTRPAVLVQMVISVLIMAVIPFTFQGWEKARCYPPFLAQTKARSVTYTTNALEEDVAAGRAQSVGQRIDKTREVEPVGIFYDRVTRVDPEDEQSSLIGHGRFYAELWLLSLLGIDFSNASKATLTATYLFFDAVHAFVLLIVISLFTKPASKATMDRFFVRMHTPVQSTPERDRRMLEENYAHPEMFEDKKVFPKTLWEILKPGKQDFIGFFGTWAAVGVVLLTLYLVFTLS